MFPGYGDAVEKNVLVLLNQLNGEDVDKSLPSAGSYSASYSFSGDQYITREIHDYFRTKGDSRIVLKTNGSASGCFGFWSKETHSVSKYAPGRSAGSETVTNYLLLGLEGRWQPIHGSKLIRLIFTNSWRKSCHVEKGIPFKQTNMRFECYSARSSLSVDTLVCKSEEGSSILSKILIKQSGSTNQSHFRRLKKKKITVTDTSEKWLILGKTPGLDITSREERSGINYDIKSKKDYAPIWEKSYQSRPNK